MKTTPATVRAWQERGARAYQDRRRTDMKRARARSFKKRKASDAPWRAEVMAARGEWCRGCGSSRRVQADHIWPRSQGGPSVVENGLPLCSGCHEDKTDSRMVIEFDWLHPSQVAWLAGTGWVSWDEHGDPHGRGHRHFGPRRARGREKGGRDD